MALAIWGQIQSLAETQEALTPFCQRVLCTGVLVCARGSGFGQPTADAVTICKILTKQMLGSPSTRLFPPQEAELKYLVVGLVGRLDCTNKCQGVFDCVMRRWTECFHHEGGRVLLVDVLFECVCSLLLCGEFVSDDVCEWICTRTPA